jgi:hypothetical protein
MSEKQTGVTTALTQDEQLVVTWRRCVERIWKVADVDRPLMAVMLFVEALVTAVCGAITSSGEELGAMLSVAVGLALCLDALVGALIVRDARRIIHGRASLARLKSAGIIGLEILKLGGVVKQVRIALIDAEGRKRFIDAPLDLPILDGSAEARVARAIGGFRQVTIDFPRELPVTCVIHYTQESERNYNLTLNAMFVAGEWDTPVGTSVGHDAEQLIWRLGWSSGLISGAIKGYLPSDHELRMQLSKQWLGTEVWDVRHDTSACQDRAHGVVARNRTNRRRRVSDPPPVVFICLPISPVSIVICDDTPRAYLPHRQCTHGIFSTLRRTLRARIIGFILEDYPGVFACLELKSWISLGITIEKN